MHSGDRPYLVSGADDKLAKVWDYQTKACVQTLEGHSHNVSAVCFHPELPVILTGLHRSAVSHSAVLRTIRFSRICSSRTHAPGIAQHRVGTTWLHRTWSQYHTEMGLHESAVSDMSRITQNQAKAQVTIT